MKTGLLFSLVSSVDTILQVRTADRTNEIVFNALQFYAKAYPAARQLNRVDAVERKLRRLVEELKAGGLSGITGALSRANAHLARERPEIRPLAVENYCRTQSVAYDGRTIMEFRRGQGNGESLEVVVDHIPDGAWQRFEVRTIPDPRLSFCDK